MNIEDDDVLLHRLRHGTFWHWPMLFNLINVCVCVGFVMCACFGNMYIVL